VTHELNRRDVMFAAAAAVIPLAPGQERTPGGLRLTGSAVQGGLVIGRVGPGNQVFVDERPVRVSEGTFCFGFGRDADKPAIVKVAYPKGYEETRAVLPKKRNFHIQRINGLPEKYVSPPKDILERIARDAKIVAEARTKDSDEDWFTEKFDWPAEGPISSVYGSQRILNGEPREAHYGVDIAAPEGTPIRAPIPGVVTLAEHFGGRDVTGESYARMVAEVAQYIAPFAAEQGKNLRDMHMLGTSGTVTTLAGVFLNLPRYDRRRIDGIWMNDADVTAVIQRLLGMTYQERADNNCISVERADLVLAGCAILDAIRDAFPLPRLRVADRGLREGMLVEMMREDGALRAC
jgi:hypothetical protein